MDVSRPDPRLEPIASRDSVRRLAVRISQRIQQHAEAMATILADEFNPVEIKRAQVARERQQVNAAHRADLERMAAHLTELRGKHVLERAPDFAPRDAARASVLAARVMAATSLTNLGLAKRATDAAAMGDLALAAECQLLLESRLPSATGEDVFAINHAMMAVTEAVAQTPEMQASAEWAGWIDGAVADTRALASIVTLDDPAETLRVYMMPETNALGTVLPVSRASDGTVYVGVTEMAGVPV
jgi:hypothetical protein